MRDNPVFCDKPDAAVYLLCLLDLTDLLSSRWVAGREDLPTDRVLPLIIDENLQEGKCKNLEFFVNKW